jgi:hypothetical protein
MTIAATALGAVLAGQASASPAGVKVGVLSCHVDSGWGYLIGSSRDVDCRFAPSSGHVDRYVGSMSKLGVDIGYTGGGLIVWDVVAPSSDVREGALAGHYAGATASATVGAGVGAHVLVGGLDKSIALQPVSVEGNTGLDVAAGVGALTLKSARPVPVRYRDRDRDRDEDAGPPPPPRY